MAKRLDPRDRARKQGVRTAQRRHTELGTDLTSQIDVFRIVARDCWLLFDTLGSLYGQYQRFEGSFGVMVNVDHPMPLQRFTAGHEYGHHVLRHGSALDDRDRIEPTRTHDQLHEIAAQAFAGEFLMPADLVNTTLSGLDYPTTGKLLQITPTVVYQMSLRFGTTYRATVTQLHAQNKLSWQQSKDLRAVQPRNIKAALGGMPQDSWADIWTITEAADGATVRGRPGDEIRVLVEETPSTGYLWEATYEGSESLTLMSNRFDPGEGSGVGGTGQRRIAYRITQPQRTHMLLRRRRPWEAAGPATLAFDIDVPQAAVKSERVRVFGPQRRQLLADAQAGR